MKLFQGVNGSMENSLFLGDDQSPYLMVPIRRASQAVMGTGVPQISILKIDTEGAETDILFDLFSSEDFQIPIGAR